MLSPRRLLSILVVTAMFYVLVVVPRSFGFLGSGSVVGTVGALFLLIGAPVAAVIVLRRFRQATMRQLLADEYTRVSGDVPPDVLNRQACQEHVDATPDDWKAWYLLSLACDLSGDHKRGAQARVKAMQLHGSWQPKP